MGVPKFLVREPMLRGENETNELIRTVKCFIKESKRILTLTSHDVDNQRGEDEGVGVGREIVPMLLLLALTF